MWVQVGILLQLLWVTKAQECRKWAPPGPDDLSVMFSDAPGASLSQHLLVYAMLRQLRQDLDVNAYMSRETYQVLSQVFQEQSLRDVPVFEDVFCVKPGSDFQTFTGSIAPLLKNPDFKHGHTLWLYPNKSGVGAYHPADHSDAQSHFRFEERFRRAMKKILKFKARNDIDDVFQTIAQKMDMDVKQVTFVGIANTRKTAALKHENLKNFKKSYFQDAMAEMR